MAWRVKDLFNLDGCVALVTGGARRLGNDMAQALAEAGAEVAVTSRNEVTGPQAADQIAAEYGRTSLWYQLEVTNERQFIQVIQNVIDDFGKLDILINNAGNPINTARPELREVKDWNYTFAVNCAAVFVGMREAAKHMIPRKSGAIINIGSETGVIGKDRRQYEGLDMIGAPVDYVAAKGAVITMTKDWAGYLGPHGIRVNCISPAGFQESETEQETAPAEFWERYIRRMPLGRAGEFGKDMKGAAVFLASEASAWITGHNLVIDGGMTAI